MSRLKKQAFDPNGYDKAVKDFIVDFKEVMESIELFAERCKTYIPRMENPSEDYSQVLPAISEVQNKLRELYDSFEDGFFD